MGNTLSIAVWLPHFFEYPRFRSLRSFGRKTADTRPDNLVCWNLRSQCITRYLSFLRPAGIEINQKNMLNLHRAARMWRKRRSQSSCTYLCPLEDPCVSNGWKHFWFEQRTKHVIDESKLSRRLPLSVRLMPAIHAPPRISQFVGPILVLENET